MKAFSGIGAEMEVSAIADPCCRKMQKTLEDDPDFQGTRYYETAEEMLESEKLDGVMIGTRCNLHTQYAKMVFEIRLPQSHWL